jgi:competence protein ComEC
MQARDNASAARSCLVLLAIAAVLGLIVCVVVALGLAPGDILPRPTPPPENRRGDISTETPLIFAVLDVGQGACVVVITPDRRTLVADAGRSPERVRQVVLPFLAQQQVTRIDYLVATNPDQDHVGGLQALIEALPVGAWVDPVIPTTNETYAGLLQMVSTRGITALRARRDMQLDLGPAVQVELLWPAEPLRLTDGEPSHNDNSVVIQITHREVRFMITGDIEQPAEEAIVELETNRGLRSDVLVVAHHGSQTSSSAAFLDVVSPDVAIVPVGPDNQYGHPHDEAIQRLRFRSIRIYRTDLDGNVVVRSDGDAYEIEVLAP